MSGASGQNAGVFVPETSRPVTPRLKAPACRPLRLKYFLWRSFHSIWRKTWL